MPVLDAAVDLSKNPSAQSYKAPLKTDAAPTAGFGGLTRSHSSPNIAKLVQEADAGPTAVNGQPRTQLMPDRTTKPQTKYECLSVVY